MSDDCMKQQWCGSWGVRVSSQVHFASLHIDGIPLPSGLKPRSFSFLFAFSFQNYCFFCFDFAACFLSHLLVACFRISPAYSSHTLFLFIFNLADFVGLDMISMRRSPDAGCIPLSNYVNVRTSLWIGFMHSELTIECHEEATHAVVTGDLAQR